MKHGKDYLADKPGITTLAQLAQKLDDGKTTARGLVEQSLAAITDPAGVIRTANQGLAEIGVEVERAIGLETELKLGLQETYNAWRKLLLASERAGKRGQGGRRPHQRQHLLPSRAVVVHQDHRRPLQPRQSLRLHPQLLGYYLLHQPLESAHQVFGSNHCQMLSHS